MAEDLSAGEPLFVFKSNNLRDVLLYMNAHSQNYVADGVGALVGGPEGVRRFLIEEVGISADQVWLEACSGLGRNRMTPRGIVTVLRALMEELNRQDLKPEDLMPIATADWGTLRHRLAGTGLEYAVVGKTGTLTTIDGGMACLAGYVYTKNEGTIVFAILDHGNNVWSNRQMEDQLLSEVINRSSSPQIISGPTPRSLLPSAGLSIATE
ncbi:MAG: D-alanyl-D-alanine carboxypeptidase [Pyrinomonadaceae bacterium]